MRYAIVLVSVAVCFTGAADAQNPTQKQIDQSVSAGARWLAGTFATGVTSNGQDGASHGVGLSAIAGLAMLEANVPISNPAIRNIAAYIRQTSPGDGRTYSLATSILFLDKLGYPSDRTMIQFLALRLASGQLAGGGWSYNCDWGLTDAQAGEVAQTLRKAKIDPEAPGETVRAIFNRIRDNRANQPKGQQAMMTGGTGDNSNTQFAIIGLWVARRNGVVIDEALAATDKYFRSTQSDAGWGYQAGGSGATPAMTCAGLISMAIGHGFKDSSLKGSSRPTDLKPESNPAPRRSIRDDKDVERGLKALGEHIKNLVGGRVEQTFTSDLYYAAWSIERVGMIYGMDTIGGVDWYLPIASMVMKTQEQNGSWSKGSHGAEASTALAILFLTKANVAGDLTSSLTGKKNPNAYLKPKTGSGEPDKPARDPATETPKPATPPREDKPLPPTADFRPPANPTGPTGMPPVGGPNLAPTGLMPAKTGAGGNPAPNGNPSGSLPLFPDEPAETKPVKKPPVVTTPVAPAASAEDKQAERLASALIAAKGDEFDRLLNEMRDSKGGVYTQALTLATARLSGAGLERVREAFASRLSRMTASTLGSMLSDSSTEVRLAAARAAGQKTGTAVVKDLIPLIADKERPVATAAIASLRKLSGRDFGPSDTAGPDERLTAIRAWKQWLAEQK